MKLRRIISLAAAALVAAGCSGPKYDEKIADRFNNEVLGPDYYALGDKVEESLVGMSLEDKLWQLFFVTPEAISGEGSVTEVSEALAAGAKARPVGGIILFDRNIKSGEQVARLLRGIKDEFALTPFLGVDEEGGTVSRLGSKGIITDNGNMSDVGKTGDSSEAAGVGERLAYELAALGFNLDFAPVADVVAEGSANVIGKRSFGSDPMLVAQMVAAETEAMQNGGVSAVLKHFPGHGRVAADSHKGPAVSLRTEEELRMCDLIPFQKGIDAGADFIMTAHISLPNVIGNNTPCSLSEDITDGLLRGEFGYGGIIITDALNMGAITRSNTSAEAAVKAVKAGADMLLMPEDLAQAHAGLLTAVQNGEISEERIDESLRRILNVKLKRGLI